jgi:hypothetical protein
MSMGNLGQMARQPRLLEQVTSGLNSSLLDVCGESRRLSHAFLLVGSMVHLRVQDTCHG